LYPAGLTFRSFGIHPEALEQLAIRSGSTGAMDHTRVILEVVLGSFKDLRSIGAGA